jgi:hypothetical protein
MDFWYVAQGLKLLDDLVDCIVEALGGGYLTDVLVQRVTETSATADEWG